ncbi:MAG: glycoside hydrolase family 2 protein [Clostridiales bacterium]|nr:glycoside hydrolase family 2 protein [Clostridiales bacterium]
MHSISNDWEFTKLPSDEFLKGAGGEFTRVRIPHTVGESPLHYADPDDYSGVFGYRKKITVTDLNKRRFVQFDGAAHVLELFVNGEKCGEHFCGYTAYRKEITEYLHEGDNLIAVRLDTTERGDVPPFGYVIDYLCFGGLYREVWLDEKEKSLIDDVYLYTDHQGDLSVQVTVDGEFSGLKFTVLDGDAPVHSFSGDKLYYHEKIAGVDPWSPESPKLYTLQTELVDRKGDTVDVRRDRFGFRSVWFNADGMVLNGRKYFMRGLNRHQCWPYIGYAAPRSLQVEDARILKEELCVNAVRTSHYPQSQHFIDACDEMGLMVFTELPGWQHIGDEAWKERSLDNIREMIMQYRNHPSIVLWGVRINESVDDDEFYKKTNALAHELDHRRQTSGVRYLEKSHLLEDVYAFNDFSHDGKTPGCKKKKDVTTDMQASFLISEHNGHMFPTKSFDHAEKRQEQALRHARVLGAAYADGEHAGCFGWCMFDYATHKDFGSGDRICYHGVLDSFRNPKLAAALYRSQGDEPYLEVGSNMDIGDYAAGNIGDVWLFTNADEVELYKNDNFVTSFKATSNGLPHPPMKVTDTVGELLKTQEGYSGRKEKLLHDSLIAAGKYGMANLPLKYKLKMGWCMVKYGLTYEDGVRLYGKYIGNWGGAVTSWRFDAKKDGNVVASVTKKPSRLLHLDVLPSSRELTEGDTYDMAAVRIRVLDENGAVAPYAQLPVKLTLEGEAELVGPSVVTAEGGMCGTYVRTVGKKGSARLTVSTDQTEPIIIDYTIN